MTPGSSSSVSSTRGPKRSPALAAGLFFCGREAAIPADCGRAIGCGATLEGSRSIPPLYGATAFTEAILFFFEMGFKSPTRRIGGLRWDLQRATFGRSGSAATGSLTIRTLDETRGDEIRAHRFLSSPSVLVLAIIDTLRARTARRSAGRRIGNARFHRTGNTCERSCDALRCLRDLDACDESDASGWNRLKRCCMSGRGAPRMARDPVKERPI